MLMFNSYKDARDAFRQSIKDGTCMSGRGKGHSDDYLDRAREVWEYGLVSLPSRTRMIELTE
jgi:hypothetical protein